MPYDPDAEFTDPQYIVDKIDNEGWPEALDWVAGEQFEDQELDQMILDAYEVYKDLQNRYKTLRKKLEQLGVDVYI
jgi:hypothetical protein